MTYKQLKWLILIIPTVTNGIWEYVRHAYLLPYISMDMGNWLSPLIVLGVTLTLLLGLFSRLERLQDELNQERAAKVRLQEREQIARELHDGIAQSLFLLSVKTDQLKKLQPGMDVNVEGVKETLRRVHDDVRQSISNLRNPPRLDALPWEQTIQEMIQDFRLATGAGVNVTWEVPEGSLTAKEKIELSNTLREFLMNVRKHAEASRVEVEFSLGDAGDSWALRVRDDGIGFTEDPFQKASCYGLRMVRERSAEMKWGFEIRRDSAWTVLEVRKGGRVYEPNLSRADCG
ncbi:sensor histidine kinase [Tumebacillus flagellatus]|uniref:histidine kinase n=1 Tax=Tumebacillus flagellatus TaxID=1157490 RepID=A0A074LSQ8_9BACL|nr:histidine kinase [Tumebacillus flagellatus]KEO82848.1 histidine kinase [Tumebacillus flagellatus]